MDVKDDDRAIGGRTGARDSKAGISFAEHASTIRKSWDLRLVTVLMTEQPSVFVFGTEDPQEAAMFGSENSKSRYVTHFRFKALKDLCVFSSIHESTLSCSSLK